MSSCSSSRRRGGALAATVLLTAAAGAGTASARTAAPPQRALCVPVATVRDAPYGFAIAYLRRPQHVSVLGDAERHRWVLIRTRGGLSGWIPGDALCRRP